MENVIKKLFSLLLMITFLLCGCSQQGVNIEDTTGNNDTDISSPITAPAKHDISISDVTSLLASNGLSTNIDKKASVGGSWHGGMQMRVCHTERGTYAVFAQSMGDNYIDGIQKYYVAKVDNEGKASLLYYGEFDSDDAEVTVNIVQDKTGDIFVSAISEDFHGVYVFDRDTDEMSKFEMEPEFKAESKLGYNQVMYDFETRKMYAFLICGSGTDAETVGDSIIEWYSFDLDTKEWSDSSILVRTEDIGRHGYLFPFPDGKGGAYIVAIRNEYTAYVGDRFSVTDTYLWDRLGLFYIPDLSTGENSEYTVVQEEDGSKGLEGIWSHVHPNQYGDVFVDSNGYMHITYRYYLMDYTGTHDPFDNQLQYRYAIYDGMECIHNEKLELRDDDYMLYRPMVRQSTDGKLHLIVASLAARDTNVIELDFYSAGDELDKSWNFVKTVTLDEGVTTDSLSLSGVRDGSVQDNTLSCFFYGYNTIFDHGAYTFNIDLTDYSVTKLINILDGFDIQIDWVYDERMPYTDNQTTVVRTENAAYAALVYNYNYDEHAEYFHIVKIDRENRVTVLHSDSFESDQNKSLTMSVDPDGMIYVCPPTGRHAYFIDPTTDEVTLRELTPILTNNLIPRQAEIVYIPGTDAKYCVTVLEDGSFNATSNALDQDKMTVALKNVVKYTNSSELTGTYGNIYTLSDGKNGFYMVGTRNVSQDDLDGKLEYNGYIDNFDDSLKMFYLSDISNGTELECIEIEAPYDKEGSDGIWSVGKICDVYLDSRGKFNVLYTYYHFDFDDADRRENPGLIESTLKHYLAVYDGGELVSKEEINMDALDSNSSLRITETADGTVYLLSCNLVRGFENLGYNKLRYRLYPEDGDAKISVYFKIEDGWGLAAEKELGEFAAEGFFISEPTGEDTVDCIVYASNHDVYHLNIDFKSK